jgi:DNA-binding transcriptional LysR family regulator
MELRQLQLFMAAADEGSITAAAKKMHLTQPALSRQIKSLEEELGVELFTRGAHSVSLTPAGGVLRGETAKLLRFCDAMIEKVRTEATGEALRVAYAPTLTRGYLSVAIERFTQFHPKIRIGLFDCSSVEMHDGLAAGNFDVILGVPCGLDAIRWTNLREYGWRLLVPVGHELAGREVIRAQDLDGVRLVILGREAYPDYWQSVTQFFKERGLQAKIAGEVDGASSLEAAVEAGMGVAIIGENSTYGVHSSRVLVKTLHQVPERITVAAGVSSLRETSPKVMAFIEELRRAASEGFTGQP